MLLPTPVKYVLLKETPRTMVTSSLNEISTDKLGKKMVMKRQALFPWMKEEKGIIHRGRGAYLRCRRWNSWRKYSQKS
jgi:hypothetical protein